MSQPGKVPPLGPEPPDGDQSRGEDIIISQFVLMGIATLLIALRLWVKGRIMRKIGWDDLLITLALVTSIIGFAFNCKMVEAGFGRHLYYLKKTDPLQIVRATRWHVIWGPTFFISVTLTRISICLLLLRIFGVDRRWRWGLWGAIALIIAIFIPSFVMLFAQCRPYAKSWNKTIPGKCHPTSYNVHGALYSGILAVIQDWALATLPIVFLWNMQIGPKQKLGICGLMSLGYFSGICAIVRTVISMRVFNAGGLADFSWMIIDLRIWGTVENMVGIIAASIPTLKPLYVKTLGSHYMPWSKKSSGKGYVEQSDEGPVAAAVAQKRAAPDPYATTITSMNGGSGGNRSYPDDFGLGNGKGEKRGDWIQVRTEIELNEFDERRPMTYPPARESDPAYHI